MVGFFSTIANILFDNADEKNRDFVNHVQKQLQALNPGSFCRAAIIEVLDADTISF